MPKTYGELFDAYRQVWLLLFERLDSLPEDEQQQAINILLQNARGLGRMQNLVGMVIGTMNELSQKSYVDKTMILAEIIRILHYDGKKLTTETRQRWEQLKEKLTGSDFASLMKRYVGMDIFEDRFDEEGNRIDQTQSKIEELAQLAVKNKELLQKELHWLVTTEAKNGYRFGYALAKNDKNVSLLPTILEAQRNAVKNADACFLGGYLRVLFEQDRERLEYQLDALMEDKNLNTWIPELTWRAGMTDRAALRILSLAERGFIGISHFWIFRSGSVIQDLSEGIFTKLIKYLLDSPDAYAVSIILDLYYFYYIRTESKYTLPEKLTLKILTHPLLFQKSESSKRNQMDDYHWKNIGKFFVQLYPEKSLDFADKMLQHFGEEGTIFDSFHSRTQEVLNEITRRNPEEIWKSVAKYLGPPKTRVHTISHSG